MSADTLPELLRRTQGTLFDRERSISYSELECESARLARGLRELGLREGDRLGLWLPNVSAWLAAFFASARLGAIAVSINTRFKSHEVGDIIERSRCRLLVYWPGFRKIDFDQILKNCNVKSLRSLSGVVAYTEGDRVADRIQDKPVYDYSALQSASPLNDDLSCPDAPCMMFTTSGTTKAPKFVVYSQQAVTRHAKDVAVNFEYVAPDAKVLVTAPLCGAFGFCNAIAAITARCTLVMHPTFDAKEAADAVQRHRITHTNATDDMFAQLLDAVPDERPFPSIRFFGFATFSPALRDLAARADARGMKLIGVYGSSEMQGLLARQDDKAPLPERALPGGTLVSGEGKVRARDPESGLVLAHGRAGELEFKAPSRMIGYFENEEANHAAITPDGWFRSGDLGYTTSDRAFVLITRLGDAIRLSGFMVSPAEIEDVLLQHPNVAAAQVSDLDLDVRAGRRAGRFEHRGSVHDDLHRLARLFRQHGRDRFEIDRNLSAEAAADFRRHDLDVAERHLQQLGALLPDGERPLRAAPNRDAARRRSTRPSRRAARCSLDARSPC